MSLQAVKVSQSTPIYAKVGNKYQPAVRNISRRVRQFSIPVLTIGAISIPVGRAAGHIGGFKNLRTMYAFQKFSSSLIASYTGFYPLDHSFNWRRMKTGLLPLLAISILNRTGLLRPFNRKLATAKIPLRLN